MRRVLWSVLEVVKHMLPCSRTAKAMNLCSLPHIIQNAYCIDISVLLLKLDMFLGAFNSTKLRLKFWIIISCSGRMEFTCEDIDAIMVMDRSYRAYYCYRAYVVRNSRHLGSLWEMLTNTGKFLRGLKICGESKT